MKYGHLKFCFNFFVFMYVGFDFSFRTLCKNCYKMQMCNSIALIFGTNEEYVMVDSCAKYTVNLRNIQGVIHVKKDDTSVTATG